MKQKRKFSEGLLDDDTIIGELQLIPGQTIIDAGCGNGYMAKQFSKVLGTSGTIYALDSDKAFINELKGSISGTNITALIGDITKPSIFQNSSIDTVYLSNVFHIFSDVQIEGFRKEVKRILKPDGLLAIVNIKKIETAFGPPLEMRSSPEELIKKVKLKPARLVDAGEYFYMQTFKNNSPVNRST